MNRVLEATRRLGQSIWLDDLRRDLVVSGTLAARVAEGLSGVTTNPAIFEKAIAQGSAYDAVIAVERGRGVGDATALYERLAIADVRAAADVLRPVYEASSGADGFVSLEVAPALAQDAEATVRDARRLAGLVDRPNLMIKVPATAAGLSACEALLARGVNVNMTLIFSEAAYRAAAQAHMAGLERLVEGGGDPARVAGVASFFVSRIDTLVDRRLAEFAQARPAERVALEALAGRTAIACAKLAYGAYEDLQASPRWRALAARGARPQRLLWASTGTKNPAYPKTLYVDRLVGPGTVNTLPEDTYLRFCAGPAPRAELGEDLEAALEQVARLRRAGILMGRIAAELLAEGLALFAQAYDRLLAALAQRLRPAALAVR